MHMDSDHSKELLSPPGKNSNQKVSVTQCQYLPNKNDMVVIHGMHAAQFSTMIEHPPQCSVFGNTCKDSQVYRITLNFVSIWVGPHRDLL